MIQNQQSDQKHEKRAFLFLLPNRNLEMAYIRWMQVVPLCLFVYVTPLPCVYGTRTVQLRLLRVGNRKASRPMATTPRGGGSILGLVLGRSKVDEMRGVCRPRQTHTRWSNGRSSRRGVCLGACTGAFEGRPPLCSGDDGAEMEICEGQHAKAGQRLLCPFGSRI